MEQKETTRFGGSIESDGCREAITAEAGVEHTLPDYMPEVRKLLRIDARAIPSGRYVEDGRCEFSGIVAYTVVYTDGEGHLSAVSLNGDYTVTCRLGGMGAPAAATADIEVESTVCRLGGPRRIHLRSTLRCRPHLVERTELTPPDTAGYECLSRPVLHRRTLTAETGEMAIYDSLSVAGLTPDEVRPLFCDGSFQPTECRAADGAVTLRGYANVRVVALGREGAPLGFSSRIPVERELSLEGAAAGDVPLVVGRPTTLSVRATSDGEGGTRLELDGAVECEVRIIKNTESTPLLGLYSTACPTELTTRTHTVERSLGSAVGSYTVSGSTAAVGEERAATVLDVAPTATVRKVIAEGGRAVVLGDVKLGLLLSGVPTGEDTEVPCFSVEYVHPFRIESELSVPAGSDVRYECCVNAVSSRARIEDTGYATDTELSLALTAYAPTPLTVVEGVRPLTDTPYPTRESSITVVYPEEGDSLWSVGERYHTTVAALTASNRLGEEERFPADPETLSGVGYLLVE
ncbi:MAG: LysM peptidoglycan-binding domain-containing protein [Clostridia bacterium]|nr:LysM peptidoglycan-binding domain-containing protein [Clostridia bacterium]